MSIVAFEDYAGPLKRARQRGLENVRRFVAKWGKAEVEKWSSLEELTRVAVEAEYEIALCEGGKEIANPKLLD